MAATRAINLLNRATANTKAAAETMEIQVMIMAAHLMVHSPASITVTNSEVMAAAITGTGAMAATAIIATTKEAATGITGIVLMAAIAGNVNTGTIAAFGDGSRKKCHEKNSMAFFFLNTNTTIFRWLFARFFHQHQCTGHLSMLLFGHLLKQRHRWFSPPFRWVKLRLRLTR